MEQNNENRYPTFNSLFENACIDFPDEPAVSWKNRKETETRTYAMLKKDILNAAGNVQARKEKHIAVMCENTYECFISVYSILMSGKILVPIDSGLNSEEVQKRIKKADVELVITQPNFKHDLGDCPRMFCADVMQDMGAALTEFPKAKVDDLAALLFTSGTNGDASVVMLTQGNLAAGRGLVELWGASIRGYRSVAMLPLHHVLGLEAYGVFLSAGFHLFLLKSPKDMKSIMKEFQPVMLLAVPAVTAMMKKTVERAMEKQGKTKQFQIASKVSNALLALHIDVRRKLFRTIHEEFGGNLSFFICGGAKESMSTIQFFNTLGILTYQGYGMTETAGPVLMELLRERRPGSVGSTAFSGNEFRIDEGELQIRGTSITPGYYKDEEKTAELFDGPWLKTGDLASRDKDGFLFLTGRKKNLIILDNGENVSPEELENKLMEIPSISEALVQERDNSIFAMVYPNPDLQMDAAAVRGIVDTDIKNLNRTLPSYQRIQIWEVRDTPLQKTNTNKIRRHQT